MKKILSVLMCVALLFGPLSAFSVVADAAESVTIYVGAVEVTSGGYLLQGASYAVNESALPSDFDPENDSYAYVDNNYLYLTNFTYNGAGYGASGERKAAIRSTGSMVLVLSGNNSITCTTSGAVGIKVVGWMNVYDRHSYTDNDYKLAPTLTVTAPNGIMIENGYGAAYYHKDAKVTLNVGESGRGIMIGEGTGSTSKIGVRLISGSLTVNGEDNNATAGIEIITSSYNGFLQVQTANLSIKGCYRGVIADDVELIDGTVKVSTTGGHGITATKGSIDIRSTDIDIYVSGVAYDAMYAGNLIKRNAKTSDIYSGDYDQPSLRIKPKKYVVVGGVYLNDGEYVENGKTTATTTKPEGGYAYYTSGTLGGKLELYNYSYMGTGSYYPCDLGIDYSENCNVCIFSPYSTELVLKGTNTLTVPESSGGYADGIAVYGSLTVSGGGELTVNANKGYALYVMANQMTLYAEFIVNSGFLNLNGSVSVYVSSAIKDNGAEFTVNGGVLNLTGGVEVYSEYNSYSRMNVNGGTVNIASYYEYGSAIDLESYAESVYTQNDGTVNVIGAEYGIAFECAIWAKNDDGYGIIEFSGGEFSSTGVPSYGTFVTDSFYLNEPMEVVEGDYNSYHIKLAVPADYIIGDVNGDGKVNNLDATAILKYDAGITEDIDQFVADANRDGKVNNLDAAMILKYDAGIIDSL